MSPETFHQLNQRFKKLGKLWGAKIFKTPSLDYADEISGYLMLAWVELSDPQRKELFAAGNEGKLMYYIKNLIGRSSNQISASAYAYRLPGNEEDVSSFGIPTDSADIEIKSIDLFTPDSRYEPVAVLTNLESRSADVELLLDQLHDVLSLASDDCADACALKVREGRNIKNQLIKEQTDRIFREAARAAGISRAQLNLLKAKYLA